MTVTPPPKGFLSDLPILTKAALAYKLWHAALVRFPRLSRYTLGARIDGLFVETIELLLLAGYASKDQKASIVARASTKLDVLKFFLQIAWEIKCLDNSVYARIATPLVEVGRMLGGWRKQLQTTAPPTDAGGAMR